MKLALLLLVTLYCYSQELTYKDSCTTYYVTKCYKNGGNMVKRSAANKTNFLKTKGLKSIPKGYEIDHIIPLSEGGSDCPDNMQLITIAEHRSKTARERGKNSKQ